MDAVGLAQRVPERVQAREDEGLEVPRLRHFYVTSLFRARVPAPTVQRLAGHEHLATTQRYAHLAGIDLTSAVDDLDRLLRGNSEVTAPSQHPQP